MKFQIQQNKLWHEVKKKIFDGFGSQARHYQVNGCRLIKDEKQVNLQSYYGNGE